MSLGLPVATYLRVPTQIAFRNQSVAQSGCREQQNVASSHGTVWYFGWFRGLERIDQVRRYPQTSSPVGLCHEGSGRSTRSRILS